MLLDWCKDKVKPYDTSSGKLISQSDTQGNIVDGMTNFTTAWQSGTVLCSLVDAIQPGCVPLEQVKLEDGPDASSHNLRLAQTIAEEKFHVPQLLDPEESSLHGLG